MSTAAIERGRKRPAPEGPRTLSHQLRALIRSVVARDEVTACEVARRADVDPKVLARFMAGTRGLTMATADRLAGAVGLKLVEGARQSPRPKGRAGG